MSADGEMADSGDLKSPAFGRAGSSPAPRTNSLTDIPPGIIIPEGWEQVYDTVVPYDKVICDPTDAFDWPNLEDLGFQADYFLMVIRRIDS